MLLRGVSKVLFKSPKMNMSIYDRNIFCFGQIKKFVLPDLGEKIKEATIKKWHVKEGDLVEEYQALADVATDKLFTQIPSSEKGKIHKRYFQEEEACEVGQVLLEIEVEDGDATSTSTPAASTQTAETSHAAPQQTIQTQASKSSGPVDTSKILATPAVRALVREHKLDITKLSGTGKDGRIMKEDVLNYLSKGSEPAKTTKATAPQAEKAAPRTAALQGLEKKTVQMTDFQKGMQKTMTEAASIPHFNFKDEFDMTKITEFRDQVRKNLNIKLTFMPFIIKAISLSLSQYPIINSWYNKDKPFEYTLVENHNISFAIDSPKGLVVPNIKNVQNLTILEVHEEFNRIIAASQAGTLGFKDLSDGTFSISNIGNIGGTYLGPVILSPQTCIVAIGRTTLQPRYIQEKGELKLLPRQIMNVSFGCDHRLLDGATVARFSTKWKGFMENPESMILHMK